MSNRTQISKYKCRKRAQIQQQNCQEDIKDVIHQQFSKVFFKESTQFYKIKLNFIDLTTVSLTTIRTTYE